MTKYDNGRIGLKEMLQRSKMVKFHMTIFWIASSVLYINCTEYFYYAKVMYSSFPDLVTTTGTNLVMRSVTATEKGIKKRRRKKQTME